VVSLGGTGFGLDFDYYLDHAELREAVLDAQQLGYHFYHRVVPALRRG